MHSSRMRTGLLIDRMLVSASQGGVYLPGGCTCQGGLLPRGCACQGGRVSTLGSGGVPAWGVYLPGGVCSRGCLVWGVPAQGVPARGVPARVNRMTDRCKNITLVIMICDNLVQGMEIN